MKLDADAIIDHAQTKLEAMGLEHRHQRNTTIRRAMNEYMRSLCEAFNAEIKKSLQTADTELLERTMVSLGEELARRVRHDPGVKSK